MLFRSDLLPARELTFDAGSLIVAAVALPGHPPCPGDRLDVAVALGGLGIRRGAEYGIGTRWHDDHGSRMALVQGGVHAGSVIAAVAHEEIDRLGDLVEQGADLAGVINVAVGQDGSDDPADHRVEADMRLAPRTPLAGTVLLDQPITWAAQLQPGTVDQQVDWTTRGAGLRRLRVEKFGTGRSRWSSWRTEPISPSVWRNARRSTAHRIRAVVIARSE